MLRFFSINPQLRVIIILLFIWMNRSQKRNNSDAPYKTAAASCVGARDDKLTEEKGGKDWENYCLETSHVSTFDGLLALSLCPCTSEDCLTFTEPFATQADMCAW